MTRLGLPRRLKLRRSLGLGVDTGFVPSSGGGYVAKAVTFAANAQLRILPSVPDSPLVTVSFWQNISQGNFDAGEYWVGHEILLQASLLNPGDVGGWLQKTSNASLFYFASDGGLVTPSIWQHIFFCGDSNHPAGQKIANMLLNGVSVLNPALAGDLNDAFTPEYAANGVILPDNGGGPSTQSYADFQMWIGQMIDPSNIDKFRDPVTGKPVDPAVAALAFGVPSILYSGNKDGFIINQGNAGIATLSGGTVDNATTSPSD